MIFTGQYREQLLKELHDRIKGIERQMQAEIRRASSSMIMVNACQRQIEETRELIRILEGIQQPITIQLKVVNPVGPTENAN